MIDLIAWLGVVPGAGALIAGAMLYGSTLNRIKNVEADVAAIQKELIELRATRETVARIDERSSAMATQIAGVDRKLDAAIGAMLRQGEPRSFQAA